MVKIPIGDTDFILKKRSDERLEYPSNGRDSKTHWPDAENNARDHRGRRVQNPFLSL